MIGIFKDRNTFQVILLFIIAIPAKLIYILYYPAITYLPNQGLLTDWINSWNIKNNSSILPALLALLILVGSALYANTKLMRQRMFSRVNLLVALSMVLMTSLIPASNALSAPLILLPLFIWIYQNLTSLHYANVTKLKLYNSGIGIGIGALLYHPFIIMLIIAMFALISTRTFKLQEWFILLLGTITPYYFFFSYEFLADSWHPLQHLPLFTLGYQHLHYKDAYDLLAKGTIIIWTMAGLYYWHSTLRRTLIQTRKNWNIVLCCAVLCTSNIFIRTGAEESAFALSAFPIAAIAASAFIYPKRFFFSNALFWFIIFIVLLTCLHYADGKI